MFALPLSIIEFVKDFAHSVGKKGDGGKKVTVAEAEELLLDAQKIAESLGALIAQNKASK